MVDFTFMGSISSKILKQFQDQSKDHSFPGRIFLLIRTKNLCCCHEWYRDYCNWNEYWGWIFILFFFRFDLGIKVLLYKELDLRVNSNSDLKYFGLNGITVLACRIFYEINSLV